MRWIGSLLLLLIASQCPAIEVKPGGWYTHNRERKVASEYQDAVMRADGHGIEIPPRNLMGAAALSDSTVGLWLVLNLSPGEQFLLSPQQLKITLQSKKPPQVWEVTPLDVLVIRDDYGARFDRCSVAPQLIHPRLDRIGREMYGGIRLMAVIRRTAERDVKAIMAEIAMGKGEADATVGGSNQFNPPLAGRVSGPGEGRR